MIWSWKTAVGCAVVWITAASLAHAAELTHGRKLSDSFSFVLNCESNRHYLIQYSQDFTNWVTATNSISRGTNRVIEIASPSPSHAFFRTVQTNEPAFPSALLAREAIDLDGYNLWTDSFDSSNPLYSTAGRWDPLKTLDHGDLISNGTIVNTNSGNLTVAGRVQIGRAETILVGPQGSVGNRAWLVGNNHGIKPGYFSTNAKVFLPDVVLPSGSAAWLPPTSGTVGGVFYNALFTNSGDFYRSGGILTGKILVTAPRVRLRVDSSINFTGQDMILLTPNASLTIYMNGPVAVFGGMGIVNGTGTPRNFLYFGTSQNTSLTIGGNGETTGTFYAPHAAVTLRAGGATTEDLSGAVAGRSIRLVGNYSIHYDESLTRGPWKSFVVLGE